MHLAKILEGGRLLVIGFLLCLLLSDILEGIISLSILKKYSGVSTVIMERDGMKEGTSLCSLL